MRTLVTLSRARKPYCRNITGGPIPLLFKAQYGTHAETLSIKHYWFSFFQQRISETIPKADFDLPKADFWDTTLFPIQVRLKVPQ